MPWKVAAPALKRKRTVWGTERDQITNYTDPFQGSGSEMGETHGGGEWKKDRKALGEA